MITTTYTCDRCAAKQETKDQFWELDVSVRHMDSYSSGTDGVGMMQVCRRCLESLIPKFSQKAPEEKPKAPTTEELITEILERCGVTHD